MIQIDIEMPKDCYECPLCHRAFDGNETRLACYGLGEWCLGDEGRLDNCPLQEVSNNSPELDKENGELISRQDVKRTSDKPILSLKLNEQLNGFRKAMDEFAESCTKILEKYGLSSDETECEQPDSDTISRQDAIDAIKKACNGCDDDDYGVILCNAVIDVIKALPPSPSSPQWIPTKEGEG